MESLQVIAKFAVSLANSVDKSLADNKVDIQDIPFLMEPLMLVGPAFAEFKNAKDAYAAASAEDKAALVAQVKEDLDLRSDRTEEIIEKSLDLIGHIGAIVTLVKA
jgi:hypothetical protein